MAGKWSALKSQYPALPEDPSRLESMKAVLDELRDRPMAELAEIQDAADTNRKELEDAASVATMRRDAARLILAEKIQQTGLERITVGGFNYSPSIEPWPVVTDKAALLAYGIDGHPEVLAYAHGTVKTLLKAFLEGDGDKLPGVDIYMKPTFSKTKAAAK